jgi:hypothetical protein
VKIQGGDVTFESGLYIFENGLEMTGGDITDSGDGVLLKFVGSSLVVDTNGNANITLHALTGNTWDNILFYTPDGDLRLTGSGERQFFGSVYAPEGTVEIAGNGQSNPPGAVIEGQVIALNVDFSGNGPAVSYNAAGQAATFGPILLNTP